MTDMDHRPAMAKNMEEYGWRKDLWYKNMEFRPLPEPSHHCPLRLGKAPDEEARIKKKIKNVMLLKFTFLEI